MYSVYNRTYPKPQVPWSRSSARDFKRALCDNVTDIVALNVIRFHALKLCRANKQSATVIMVRSAVIRAFNCKFGFDTTCSTVHNVTTLRRPVGVISVVISAATVEAFYDADVIIRSGLSRTAPSVDMCVGNFYSAVIAWLAFI